MQKIRKKAFIGLIFALMAILISVVIKMFKSEDFVIQDLAFNFTLFFLAGYVVLGNLFVNNKAD